MNISNEIYPTAEFNSSSDYPDALTDFLFAADIIIFLSVCPVNLYVIWLIITAAGNGLSAEFFNLNLSLAEMCFGLESLLNLIDLLDLLPAAMVCAFLAIIGRPVFQSLMCVERYLAVVHPVTFLKYKPLHYRVICSAIAWISIFALAGSHYLSRLTLGTKLATNIFPVVALPFFLLVQLFCLVTVLRALKQSGPGDRKKEEGNHMKKRAFNLILITTISTLFIYAPYITVMSLFLSLEIIQIIVHVINVFHVLFVMAGFMQPLFFLYRVNKIPFIKSS